MKEKLVEEWLTRSGERGGIDQAFGQWLISQGHEILWLGHSSTEFGKDIISIAPDGSFHAFQIKDENLNLREMRRIHDQVKELIELPPVHPRIPAGSAHYPHLVTSGIANEEATERVRATNDALRAAGRFELDLVDRRSLIPRFVRMSDSFWPEQPANIRDFFSFYLAKGTGDFDQKKFSSVLVDLLDGFEESTSRKEQRIAAVGLLGNYLLRAFEQERDHWSLFQGWTILAAHLSWAAAKSNLPKGKWIQSFMLAKSAAIESLIELSIEGLNEGALTPRNWEFDDYVRARNTIVASTISAACLLGKVDRIGGIETVSELLLKLLQDDRLVCWGESAVVHLCSINWATDALELNISPLHYVRQMILSLAERNNVQSDDEPLDPPHVSADEVLARLFVHRPRPDNRPPRGRNTWTLQALIHFLARRNDRDFLEANWRAISKLSMASFEPDDGADILIWQCNRGRELHNFPRDEQSWATLVQEAQNIDITTITAILRDDPDFALMFLLAHPHRISPPLLGLVDHNQCTKSLVPRSESRRAVP